MKHLAIISIMESYPWGGSEELWHETAKEALNKNIQVSISYKYWDSLPSKILAIRALGAQIYLRKNKSLFPSIPERVVNKLTGRKSVKMTYNCFENILKTSPDVILINEGAFLSILHYTQLYELLKTYQIPYFILSHQNREYGSVKAGWYNVAKEIYHNAKKVFFVSERNKDMANILLAQNLKKSYVVRNPVNLENFNEIPYPPNNSIIKLATVGRLDCQQKGQDILLRALANLSKDFNFMLTFYGTGDDEPYLKELTNYLDLGNFVHFAGFEKDVKKIWKENEALILTSHYEGMPLVVVEAMLCGRPCILTDVAGNGEWILHDKNGFIAGSPTVNNLTSVIYEAFLKRDNWEEMGRNAFDTASKIFDKTPGRTLLEILCK